MATHARTDRALVSASAEYLWDASGHPGSHDYLLRPVHEALKRHASRVVLDLGCGNGSFAARLRDEGYEVTGLDHSSSGIAIAQCSYPRVRFGRHDLADPLPETHACTYDAVVTLEVIEHLLLPRRLMEAARAALRPGGLLVLSTPYHGYWKNLALALTGKFDVHWHPLRDYGHVKFFSKATILPLFYEFGFTSVQWRTAGRVPPFGCSMIVTGTRT